MLLNISMRMKKFFLSTSTIKMKQCINKKHKLSMISIIFEYVQKAEQKKSMKNNLTSLPQILYTRL